MSVVGIKWNDTLKKFYILKYQSATMTSDKNCHHCAVHMALSHHPDQGLLLSPKQLLPLGNEVIWCKKVFPVGIQHLGEWLSQIKSCLSKPECGVSKNRSSESRSSRSRQASRMADSEQHPDFWWCLFLPVNIFPCSHGQNISKAFKIVQVLQS